MILRRVECFGYCALDINLNRVNKFPKGCRPDGEYVCQGLYYEYEKIFFALYKTPNGPMMYYKGNKYPLVSKLTINVDKSGRERRFSIKEYGIEINYPEPKYLWDEWLTEEEIDLLLRIANNYKDKSFYELFTSKE